MPTEKKKDKPKSYKTYIDYKGTGYDYALAGSPVITKTLPAGAYSIIEDDRGMLYARKASVNMNELIRFPNSIGDQILTEFEQFWQKKKDYLDRGESHKRGYLLYGPPGSGKSSLLNFMIQDFIKAGNLVFIYNSVLAGFLPHFREVEPDRKLMIIIEDLDVYIETSSENRLLQFLDGNYEHVNTVFMATTNYIERIPQRLKDRPSRFDRTEKIGMPSNSERKLYIEKKSREIKKDKEFLNKLIKDTKGFSLAHLKELILAIEVYDIEYKQILNRLRKMIIDEDDSIKYEKEYVKQIKERYDKEESKPSDFLDTPGRIGF